MGICRDDKKALFASHKYVETRIFDM